MNSSLQKYHFHRFALCAAVCTLLATSAALLRHSTPSDASHMRGGVAGAHLRLNAVLRAGATRQRKSARKVSLAQREQRACPARLPVDEEGKAETAWISNRTRLAEVVKTMNLRYFRAANVVLMTIAKGGTVATMQSVFQATTGRSIRERECKGPPQFMRSNCWKAHASYVMDLSRREQARVLSSALVFRMAVQVHPFHRLVSAFKSKFACHAAGFHTDHGDVKRIVPRFRKAAKLPQLKEPCMNISEFALGLDRVRKYVGQPGFLRSLKKVDVHLRPQDFYFDDIPYDMVIDVKDLGNARVMAPFGQRFEFGQSIVENGIARVHSTGSAELIIPDTAASMMHSYAKLSKVGKLKYMKGHEPLPSAE